MSAGESDALVVLGQTGHGKTVFLASLVHTWLEGESRAGRLEFLSDSDEKARRSLDQVLAIPEPGRRTSAQMVSMIIHAIEDGEAIEGTKEPEDFYVQWFVSGDEALRRGRQLTLRDVPGYVFEEGVRWEQRGSRWGEFLENALGLFLVIDLHETVTRARESRFSEIIHRYVHALRAAEAAAKRCGIRQMPVAVLFARADLEDFGWTVAELAELDALRPLFAALEEDHRQVVTHVDIVSCLRSAQPDGETDRQVLRNVAEFLSQHLLTAFHDRQRAQRRRRLFAASAMILFLYIAWCAFAAWRLGSVPANAESITDLRQVAEELVEGREAFERWRLFPWWPGKDSAAVEQRLEQLSAHGVELLRDHAAMREAPAEVGRTRVEYETAMHGLEILAGEDHPRVVALLGAEPWSQRKSLLRAKADIARLPGDVRANLYAWERAFRDCKLEILKPGIAARIRPVVQEALDELTLSSSKEDLGAEAEDLLTLQRFDAAHPGVATDLVRARLVREWEHVRLMFEERRGSSPRAPSAILSELVHLWRRLGAPRPDFLARGIAVEIGRTYAAGAERIDRQVVDRALAAEGETGVLVRALYQALPKVYQREVVEWSGEDEEGRAWLVQRVAGLGDLITALRAHCGSERSAAGASLDRLAEHLRTLAEGEVGPYQIHLVKLDQAAGDERFWELLRNPPSGEFRDWSEPGGIAKPNIRFFDSSGGSEPFQQGWLEPGYQGWEPLKPLWEGDLKLGNPFSYQAGRSIEAVLVDAGLDGYPRHSWHTCNLARVSGAFAPERLGLQRWEVFRMRQAGGKSGVSEGAKRELEAARQILRVWFEVSYAGHPLREGGAAFDFRGWREALPDREESGDG